MTHATHTRSVASALGPTCLVVLACACALAACGGDSPSPDDTIYVDASPPQDARVDASDGAVVDARVPRDAGDAEVDANFFDAGAFDDAAVDAGLAEDATVDSGATCAAPCTPSDDCDTSVCVDGACVSGAVADGQLCRTATGICVFGACVTRACGDGYREPGPEPARESCDDGNVIDGDGCSSLCEVSAVGMPGSVAFELAAPTSHGPALATDGTGASFAVWYTSAGGGRVMGLRYDAFGAPVDTASIVIDAAVHDNAAPVVAGRAGGGWAVVFVAGGAMQLRTVSAAGAAGARQAVAPDATATGPNIVSLASGFVVAWTETYAGTDATDPYEGVRARRFDDAGSAMGAVLTPASRRDGSQQRVALAALGDVWLAAWSHTPAFGDAGDVVVRGRRFRGGAAIEAADRDLTPPNSFAPALAVTRAGTFVLAYEGLSGTSVDIGARRLPLGDAADIGWGATSTAWPVAFSAVDERLTSITAAGDGDGVAIAYTFGTGADPAIALSGATPGPELDALVTAWGSDDVRNLALAPARRGVIVLWSTRVDSLRGVATRGVATMYLGVE